MRKRLDQLELGGLDEGDHTLRDLFVIERVGYVVAACGAPAVHRHLKIENNRLLDTALPLDETDDAFDGEATKKNYVGGDHIRHVRHQSVAENEGAIARGRQSRAHRVARLRAWPDPPPRLSRHCRYRTRGAD